MDATTPLTVAQAAALVGVHRATVYRAIRSGDIHADRFGRTGAYRIAPKAVDAWLGRQHEQTVHSPPDLSGGLSRPEVVRLLVESDGSHRDIEIAPGVWERTARPLTAEERGAYASVSRDEIADARELLRTSSDLLLARLVQIADRLEEIVEGAELKTEKTQ